MPQATPTKPMSSHIDQIQQKLMDGSLSLPDLLSLRRELRAPFRLHPLGFFACTLFAEGTRKVRLHFWPLEGGAPQSPDCQIHDHIFEFRSWVFGGSVENIEYLHSTEGIEYAVYRTDYSDSISTLTKTDASLRLVVLRRCTYSAGSSYEVPSGVLHETARVGPGPAFTLLVTNDVSTVAPSVLGPKDGRDGYIYERVVMDDKTVETMIAEAQSFV